MRLLKQYFDLILLISLPEREDRRTALLANLHATGLADPGDIRWTSACTGDHAGGPPLGWTAGRPAWGCLQSHLTCLDIAQADGAKRTLILEDDAVFSNHAAHILRSFMEAVPDDWAQIYLGGNHALRPLATANPLVWEAGGVTATHAYAVADHAVKTIRDRLADLQDYTEIHGWHCDSHLAKSHGERRWRTYTPSWWMAAQEDSVSDINRRHWPRRWFHSYHWRMDLPFILIDEWDNLTSIETSVVHLPDEPAPAPVPELLEWLHSTAAEALRLGRLPAMRVSADTPTSTVQALWPAGTRAQADSDLPALADYPFNQLFPHPITNV